MNTFFHSTRGNYEDTFITLEQIHSANFLIKLKVQSFLFTPFYRSEKVEKFECSFPLKCLRKEKRGKNAIQRCRLQEWSHLVHKQEIYSQSKLNLDGKKLNFLSQRNIQSNDLIANKSNINIAIKCNFEIKFYCIIHTFPFAFFFFFFARLICSHHMWNSKFLRIFPLYRMKSFSQIELKI
jgi:hypothetical protein